MTRNTIAAILQGADNACPHGTTTPTPMGPLCTDCDTQLRADTGELARLRAIEAAAREYDEAEDAYWRHVNRTRKPNEQPDTGPWERARTARRALRAALVRHTEPHNPADCPAFDGCNEARADTGELARLRAFLADEALTPSARYVIETFLNRYERGVHAALTVQHTPQDPNYAVIHNSCNHPAWCAATGEGDPEAAVVR